MKPWSLCDTASTGYSRPGNKIIKLIPQSAFFMSPTPREYQPQFDTK